MWLLPDRDRIAAGGVNPQYTLEPGASVTLGPTINRTFYLGQLDESEAENIAAAIERQELSGYEIGFPRANTYEVFANDGTSLGPSQRDGAFGLDQLGIPTQPYLLECTYELGIGVGLRYCPPQIEGR